MLYSVSPSPSCGARGAAAPLPAHLFLRFVFALQSRRPQFDAVAPPRRGRLCRPRIRPSACAARFPRARACPVSSRRDAARQYGVRLFLGAPPPAVPTARLLGPTRLHVVASDDSASPPRHLASLLLYPSSFARDVQGAAGCPFEPAMRHFVTWSFAAG